MVPYPSLQLAAAKLEAAEYRKQIVEGLDPKLLKEDNGAKELRKHNDNFLTVATMWFERKRKSISPFHAERTCGTLEKYVFDHFGALPISEISRCDAIEAQRPLETDGKLSTIKRICQSLNQIMEFAVASDVIAANPLTKMLHSFEKHQVENMPTKRPELLSRLDNYELVE